VGFVVDAAATIKQRLNEAGYQQGFIPAAHPYRTRIYFVDPDGLQWEFVEYLSDEPGKRNDYTYKNAAQENAHALVPCAMREMHDAHGRQPMRCGP
jgi:hypothetical protein